MKQPEDYMELDLYYTVTAEGVEPFSALANTDDLTSGLVNINIPNLQAGIEYTLTIDKVDVINYNKMDWETFEVPSEFKEVRDVTPKSLTEFSHPVEDFIAKPKEVDNAIFTGSSSSNSISL